MQIVQEDLTDRTRIYLMDGENEVGKLTLQNYAQDKTNYYMTAFWIDSQYREQGWGTKMMQRILSLPQLPKLQKI